MLAGIIGIPSSDWSTGKLMSENGVKYVNTSFMAVSELNLPVVPDGGFDHGVLVINRINYGNEWFEPSSLPKEPFEKYKSDIIETHFINWIATDDFLQLELNQKWIEYFAGIQADPEHYLAKITVQLFSQWLYKYFTTITENKTGIVIIDNSKMPVVGIKCNKPVSIGFSNPNLRIISHQYNSDNELLSIEVCGCNMQGETGRSFIKFSINRLSRV